MIEAENLPAARVSLNCTVSHDSLTTSSPGQPVYRWYTVGPVPRPSQMPTSAPASQPPSPTAPPHRTARPPNEPQGSLRETYCNSQVSFPHGRSRGNRSTLPFRHHGLNHDKPFEGIKSLIPTSELSRVVYTSVDSHVARLDFIWNAYLVARSNIHVTKPKAFGRLFNLLSTISPLSSMRLLFSEPSTSSGQRPTSIPGFKPLEARRWISWQ